MLIRKPDDVPSSEITPEAHYLGRRAFIGAAGALGLAAATGVAPAALRAATRATRLGGDDDEKPTSYEAITHYNNFYEFGTGKEDPAENAGRFKPRPWSVTIDGLVKKPGTYNLEDFIKPSRLQERIYRHRCVEAWSMVIPWQGFPISDVIRRVEPLGSAKFVEFITVERPAEMPGQRTGVLDWPYTEALRLDEAMHPLAIFAVGIYGKPLLNQNGAPLRHVVPWKYGFKGAKSIVKMRFVETQPKTAWNVANPDEYGFYSNVNPTVDHPRWSQAKERRIGEFLRRPTLMFNGYASQVQGMYAGMDLRKNY